MAGNDADSEGKLRELLGKMSTLEDLQNLVQLDIINLKNEIDKIRLTSSQAPVSAEDEDRIIQLQHLSKDVDMFKRWKQTVDEVRFIRDKLMGAKSAGDAPAGRPDDSGEIEEIKRDIEQIRKDMKKSPSIDLADLRAAIDENRNAVENLKRMLAGRPKGAVPDIDSLKRMIGENRRLVEELKVKMENSKFSFPAEAHMNIDGLHEEVTKLEDDVRRLKTEKLSGPAPKDDIDHLRRELFTKLDDLNVRFGPKSADEMKKAMEANRASIERLKALISGEETSIEGMKQEMGENRKFMEDVKKTLLTRKPGARIVMPQDAEAKKRMSQMELRVETLSRRLEKMADLRPIKLPEFAQAKGAKAAPETEGLRKEIDIIISRMDGFLTKDDVEKGFLEKRLKTDGKLITGDLYKDMNDIKKAVVRNEDHITNVASDIEKVKREIGTVEKREWGKVSEIPTIEELKRRLEELEKRVEEGHGGPMFIE